MKECKLIIRDEVNVKLEGLELGDRKTSLLARHLMTDRKARGAQTHHLPTKMELHSLLGQNNGVGHSERSIH